jgi:hypothetical protein
MSDTIYLGSTQVPKIDLSNTNYFLNRLTICWGGTGCGKSTIIRDIVASLSDKIPIGIACCPTAQMSGDYDGLFPPQCIHDDVTKDLMQRIFQRQTNIIAMYDLVHDPSSIEPLYRKVANDESKSKLDRLAGIYNKGCNDIRTSCDETELEITLKELRAKYDKKKTKIMRNVIIENTDNLLSRNLTNMQRTIVKNMMIVPEMLLLIDDCAASAKEWAAFTETKQMFFQSRHYRLTVFLAFQEITILPPPLRMNSHINIFTSEKILNSYVSKASTGISTDERKRLSRIAMTIFAPSENKSKPNYKKLVLFSQIIKCEHSVQYIIASIKRKRFGSTPLWRLCDEVKKEVTASVSSRSFNKMFELKQAPSLDSIPS